MMDNKKSERDIIHAYLKTLGTYLSRLDKQDADEAVREIESHIYDSIDAQQAAGKPVDLDMIIGGFGDPRELASAYVDHILTGAPPPAGFRAIERVKRGVTTGLLVAMAVFGFGIAASLGLLAIIKLFDPSSVGVWSTSGGNAFAVGFLSNPTPDNHELLGFWLPPLFALLSVATAWLTVRVLRALKPLRR